MSNIHSLNDVIQEENKLRFRGYNLTLEGKYMTNIEIVELINLIKLTEEKYQIKLNQRQHCIGNEKYLLSVEINLEGQGTALKLFLASHSQYKLYRRMKTYKELAN